jgi:hypothetical protein
VEMFRLDYLSCLLTVVATILVGRKMWTGLVVSGVNSLIVCVIGVHTSQYGFIPANVFCICINAFNLKLWLNKGGTITPRPNQLRIVYQNSSEHTQGRLWEAVRTGLISDQKILTGSYTTCAGSSLREIATQFALGKKPTLTTEMREEASEIGETCH